VTAFEPFVFSSDLSRADFVQCADVGVFPPVAKIRLGEGPVPTLRQLNMDSVEHDGTIDIPKPKPTATNPWGAVMFYVEARGQALNGRGEVSATLLSGCGCIRTQDAPDLDSPMDRMVKNACVEQTGGERSQPIALRPVLGSGFHLEPCDIDAITAPGDQLISPGPGVCVGRDPSTSGRPDCYPNAQSICTDPERLSSVPILFTLKNGPDTSTQIVISDSDGAARAKMAIAGCPADVNGQVLGAPQANMHAAFKVSCVPPVSAFLCTTDVPLPVGLRAISAATLPQIAGTKEQIAILYDQGGASMIEVRNPDMPDALAAIQLPAERPLALHGFAYKLGARRQEDTRPVLAVATSKPIGGADTLLLHTYEWQADSRSLVSRDPGGLPIAEACSQSVCGPGASCALSLGFGVNVALESGDVDHDGFADLAIATDAGLPVTIYYSSQAQPGTLYTPQGCTCGQFSDTPSRIGLVRLGGPQVPPPPAPLVDLVIGSLNNVALKYAQPAAMYTQSLTCGQAHALGFLGNLRDLARGRFQCDAMGAVGCSGYEDLVIVMSGGLSGPQSDVTRLVFADPMRDVSKDGDGTDRTNAKLDLVARALDQRMPPSDAATARMGDVNGDGYDDLAVLYKASAEVHLWLGAGNRALSETAGIDLSSCGGAPSSATTCDPMRDIAVGDFDGDGAEEVAVVCNASRDARLRRWVPLVGR
jgi:hypothetical protein